MRLLLSLVLLLMLCLCLRIKIVGSGGSNAHALSTLEPPIHLADVADAAARSAGAVAGAAAEVVANIEQVNDPAIRKTSDASGRPAKLWSMPSRIPKASSF